MLDLNHPQTKHIFEASRMEDRIRVHLVAWRKEDVGSSLSKPAIDEIKACIEKLHTLNQSQFCASAGITCTLMKLETAVVQGTCEESWKAFHQLAESPGDNFGTWAI